MNEYGRGKPDFYKFCGDVFHLAPVPVVYKIFDDSAELNRALVDVALRLFSSDVLDVPDERQVDKLGAPIFFSEEVWKERQVPAIGIWHRVPTNNFLKFEDAHVVALKQRIEEEYQNALRIACNATNDLPSVITESWIQFYQNGDKKVLHNHARYGPPYTNNSWAGAYYIDDGAPDANMPYSGVFSFRVRDNNYYVKPKAGLLIMWPAEILHEVHPFYGERNRIVINFNINTGFHSLDE